MLWIRTKRWESLETLFKLLSFVFSFKIVESTSNRREITAFFVCEYREWTANAKENQDRKREKIGSTNGKRKRTINIYMSKYIKSGYFSSSSLYLPLCTFHNATGIQMGKYNHIIIMQWQQPEKNLRQKLQLLAEKNRRHCTSTRQSARVECDIIVVWTRRNRHF